MKLFIVAALVTVAAAGRLEHLERAYLPPNQGSGQYSQSTFGSNSLGGFGGSGSHGSGSSGHNGFGSSGSFENLRSSGSFGSSAFPGATINQYLPPDHGPSSGSSQFSGSLQGFSNGNQRSHQYASQYESQSNNFGSSPTFGNQGQPQRYSQFPAASRQYLAPSSGPSYPQQAFDEETGYHY